MTSASPAMPLSPPSGILCPTIQAVILSAGKAKRANGINKSFMHLKGRPILEYQLERLRPVFADRIAVVTNRPEDYARQPVFVVPDLKLEPDEHRKSSLHGMVSVLSAFPDRWCFTLPCDMPYPDMEILRLEVEHLRRELDSSPMLKGLCMRDDKHLRPYHSLIHGSMANAALRAFQEHQIKNTEISTRDWLESLSEICVLHHADLGVSAEAFERCQKNFNRIPGAGKS